uniref:Uncharacterized protein n=1 Tax=Schizaphis graminum TaxID=13262 RepID=A0A2S2PJ00_SCHGA
MGVWCGFVAVRYGERFDFLLKLRRPVVCVYYTFNIYMYYKGILSKRIYISYTRWIRKCLPGSPQSSVYHEKVPPPAGFLLYTRVGLTTSGYVRDVTCRL